VKSILLECHPRIFTSHAFKLADSHCTLLALEICEKQPVTFSQVIHAVIIEAIAIKATNINAK